jgi:hypothetical protein
MQASWGSLMERLVVGCAYGGHDFTELAGVPLSAVIWRRSSCGYDEVVLQMDA